MQKRINQNNYKGLSKEQVENSRKQYGSNQITTIKRKTFLNHYCQSFGDPTIKILLVALLLNMIFFIKHFNWYESIGILVSIILATFVSSISEYGSQLAFEKLMEDSKKIKCKVYRDNSLTEIPVSEVVKGDYINLQSGDKIPADGILIDGALDVDQSALNGETKEAHKIPSNILSESHRNDLLNECSLFNGSVVTEGEGIMIVKDVGDKTFYGHLAKELQEDAEDSPLKQKLTELAKTISRFGYMAAMLILATSLFKSIVMDNHYNLAEIIAYTSNPLHLLSDILRAITFAITIIVVAVPEGLPVMITVVLSSNMKRMIKDNVLVRKMVGIETAGSLNILFTDKTGTLTKGKLEVSEFITGNGNDYKNKWDIKIKNKLWKLIYVSCFYNNSSNISSESENLAIIGGNSTDRAILNFVAECPINNLNITKTAVLPFKSQNKYSMCQIDGDMCLTLIKGAPEKILPHCSKYFNENGEKNDILSTLYITQKINSMTAKGIRILALATSEENIENLNSGCFSDLTLVGIVGIRDEVRDNVRDSVLQVSDAGVQVVMITGDSKNTAKAIAEDAGLLKKEKSNIIIDSNELNNLSDEEVVKIMPHLRVVARALPSDKSRLIKISQQMGLVAGMTGDGVNDAPALKKADVGFSMGSGTEIAKEASDIVILDDNFLSICKAILYGRTIFKSIRKFIIFQLSINLCAVLTSLIGQFIGLETPITVIQMLWVNMVMDTLAGLAFAGEPPLPEYMEELPKNKSDKIINKYMENQIFFTGLYTTFLCVLFLKAENIHHIFRNSQYDLYFLTGFFALFMFCAIFNSLNCRTQRINLLAHILKNKYFVVIMAFVSIIQIIMIYYGGKVFRAYGLNFTEFFTVISLSITVIPFDFMRKSILRLRHTKEEVAKFL